MDTATLETPPVETPSESNLPESASIKVDHSAHSRDADKFFQSEPKVEPKVEPKPEARTEVKVETPKPTSLADQLAARSAPPPKPEEKPEPKPEATHDPIEEIEKKMAASNPKWKPAEGWQTLKQIAQTEKQKRAELEGKVAELETKVKAIPSVPGMTPEEVEKLKAAHKSARDRLMLVDLENHPSFREQYTDKRDAELARAAELLSAHNIKADLKGLLAKPRGELGKAVEEMTKDVPGFDRTEVADAIRKAYQTDQAAKQALASSKEILSGIQKNSLERQKAAFEKRFLPVSQQIAQHLVKLEAAPDASPEERAEVEAYINGGKNIRTQAEKYAFAVADDETAAEVAMKAAAYDFHIGTVQPRLLKEYSQIVADNRRLATELAALRNRNPNLRIAANPNGDHAPKRMEDMSHEEAAEALARK